MFPAAGPERRGFLLADAGTGIVELRRAATGIELALKARFRGH
jgi:hypothetical protein